MTAPLQVAPPPADEQQPEQRSPAEEALLALLAAYLAAGAAATIGGLALTPALLVSRMVGLGISRQAARASLALALQAGRQLPAVPTGTGRAAQRATARLEPVRRAAYLLNAAKRLTRSLTAPPLARPSTPGAPGTPGSDEQAPGTTAAERLADALERERRYLRQHIDAGKARRAAAEKVDAAALVHGQLLGWRAVMDERTTGECAAMNGKNFQVTAPPPFGLPGAVHPTCRCSAGAPYPNAPTVTPNGATS